MDQTLKSKQSLIKGKFVEYTRVSLLVQGGILL
jgi:hypothetical protein